MSARRVVGGIGRVLVAVGVLLLLFVVYQLFGTNLAEARSQKDLRASFRRSLQTTSTTTAPGGTIPAGPASTTTTVAPPPAPAGAAVAVLRIPKIGVDKAIVQGVGVPDLKKAPGHYPTTPMPGQPGNAGIAGHRTTYGAPFYRLDQLGIGDVIRVTTRQGTFRFEVESSRIVRPDQTEVLDQPTDGSAHLTLTTCNPRFSARQRLVVSAVLKGEPAPAPPPTVAPTKGDAGGDTGPVAVVEAPSLSGDRSAAAPTVLWGLVCALVALATWFAARRWRRWPAYLLGSVVFLVVLFVFFENVSRLLPANI